MKDRFSDATRELSEKNAFICDTCNTESGRTVISKQAVEVDTRESHEPEEGLHVSGLDVGLTGIEKIIYSDPTPFGA